MLNMMPDSRTETVNMADMDSLADFDLAAKCCEIIQSLPPDCQSGDQSVRNGSDLLDPEE